MINYENFSILTSLLIGLIGNFHCLGMCSGIITILSISILDKKKIYIYQIYYNMGRLTGYIIINICVFILGFIFIKLFKINNLNFLKFISGLTLLMISFYLLNISNLIKNIEVFGLNIWINLSKYIKPLFPVKNFYQAIFLGVIWSHLPCGLVYSTIVWSTSSGSLSKSIILIFFFGLGTLPSMLSIGIFSVKMKSIYNHKIIRLIVGIFFLLFSLYNMYIFFFKTGCH
ncbi:MAG TPA: sulfite exporter TauE/SafE family protein [Candidatus Azoamicus sp.]